MALLVLTEAVDFLAVINRMQKAGALRKYAPRHLNLVPQLPFVAYRFSNPASKLPVDSKKRFQPLQPLAKVIVFAKKGEAKSCSWWVEKAKGTSIIRSLSLLSPGQEVGGVPCLTSGPPPQMMFELQLFFFF